MRARVHVGAIAVLLLLVVLARAHPTPIEQQNGGARVEHFELEDHKQLNHELVLLKHRGLKPYMMSMRSNLQRLKKLVSNRLCHGANAQVETAKCAEVDLIDHPPAQDSASASHDRDLDHHDITQTLESISRFMHFGKAILRELDLIPAAQELDMASVVANLVQGSFAPESLASLTPGDSGETQSSGDLAVRLHSAEEQEVIDIYRYDPFLQSLESSPIGPFIRPYLPLVADLLKAADAVLLWRTLSSDKSLNAFPDTATLGNLKVVCLISMVARVTLAMLKHSEMPRFPSFRGAVRGILGGPVAEQSELATDFAFANLRELPEEGPLEPENWTLIDTTKDEPTAP